MDTAPRLTSADLECLPEDGKRYELIDGELYVSRQPDWRHQYTCVRLSRFLDEWSERSSLGMANAAPGIIFAEDEDVAPDVVWISFVRLAVALQEDGHLHAAPELVIEVLSPGSQNERRDRQTKLKLYARRGVEEYWIADWQQRRVEVFRREQATLVSAATLYESDSLQSPLLSDFCCPVRSLFMRTSSEQESKQR
ncbi:Uma2 family endonuclease [Gloeobacter morelensis]|uniref:Uma2 family endonuclease n=1 Tax=Gloeobacter morelensis MG652769 TaxID=2781736 RepID=A0ABY3PH63_9CYAN|nr:Uma2 family endonuclease [Gloeobacter morelensis]UFP92892.1 Uma2 family endonuclease [Gloeobacter morelensis MG652769]